MPGRAGVQWEGDGEQHPAVGTGTPGHPKTLLDMHPLFAFHLDCQALPFPPSAERRERLQLPCSLQGWAGMAGPPRQGKGRAEQEPPAAPTQH